MALVTYPLNNIEYSAEDAELFHVTRTSGIYANDSFNYSVSGADNAVVIGTGIGWIKNSEFSGKVIAQKESISLDMGLPDSVHPRIDAIVIQFDSNRNETNIVAKTGVASSVPVAPTVVRTESVYELHLYHVLREAGSLYITPSNITDLRLNSYYCGLMADSVTNIDTTAIERQVADLIESLQNEISNVIDGSAYLLRNGSTNMTGNLSMDGHKVTGLGTPTEDGDAVPKKYIDNLSASDVGAFSNDELIPLSNGGTGRDLGTIAPFSIIRAASNSAYLLSTPTADGAFFATGDNKAAKFATLPIAQGGTGATTAPTARANLKTPYIKCLWTNASIGTEFPAQSISCSCNDYDYVMVLFTSGDSVANLFSSGWVKTNVYAGQTAANLSIDSSAVWAHTRYFDVRSNAVKFSAGQQADVHGNVLYNNWNDRAVPYKIIGIKFNEEA